MRKSHILETFTLLVNIPTSKKALTMNNFKKIIYLERDLNFPN